MGHIALLGSQNSNSIAVGDNGQVWLWKWKDEPISIPTLVPTSLPTRTPTPLPTPSALQYLLDANSSFKQEKYEDAILNINRAIELEPDNSKAFTLLGLIYLRQENPDEAITTLKKAVELDPKNAYAYLYLSVAFEDLKAFGPVDNPNPDIYLLSEAIDALVKACELDKPLIENQGVNCPASQTIVPTDKP